MGWNVRSSVGFVVLLGATLALAGDGHDGQLPKTPAQALDWSKELIEAARAAKSAQPPEVAKGIRRAVDWMQPYVTKGSADATWAAAWNEALTLSKFHGNKPAGEYAMKQFANVDDDFVFSLPVGRGWRNLPESAPFDGSAARGGIHRSASDSAVVSICFSLYFASQNYGDIGGENATLFAKFRTEYQALYVAKPEPGSGKVTTKALSRAFPRTAYVETTGLSKDGRVRVRTYMVKFADRTYGIDVIEKLDPPAEGTPCDAWLMSGENPELDAVLKSFAENDKKRVK